MATQEEVERLAEQSDMTESEVREWLAESSVKPSDVVSIEDGEIDVSEVRGEDEIKQEAVDEVTGEYDHSENVDGQFVYELCDDLGIRYMTSEVVEEAKEELQDDD